MHARATGAAPIPADPASEAQAALQALGYKPAEAARLVQKCAQDGDDAEAIIAIFTVSFVDLVQFVHGFSISQLLHELASVLLVASRRVFTEVAIKHVVDVVFGHK